MRGPEIDTSALIIVDMQNDFVHPDGGFAHRAREASERLSGNMTWQKSRCVG
jgi:nicotinamidase-related amidase